MTFETRITILTIENLSSVNISYLTINCDTGQHSRFMWSVTQRSMLLLFTTGDPRIQYPAQCYGSGIDESLGLEEISKRKSSCYFLSSWRSLISLSHLNFQDCEGESLSLLLTHDTLFFAPLSLPVRKALYFWRDTYIFRVRNVVENSHLVKL